MSTPKPNLAIRLPSDAKQEFDAYCEANKCTQPEAVQKLLCLQKLDDAARNTPEMAAIINDFRHHAASLVSLLEASLVLSDGAAMRAREEFADQLVRNDKLIRTQEDVLSKNEALIAELQAQLTSTREECDRANQMTAEISARYEYAQQQMEEMKQKMSAMLEESSETHSLSRNYQRLLEEVNELRRENKALSDRLKDAEIAHAGELLRLEAAKHQAELEAERLKHGSK